MIPYKEITISSDGALSFSIRNSDERPWWWYLDLNGSPLYLIGNACGTCEAIFERVQNTKLLLTPHELSTRLADGVQVVSQDIIQTVSPLLPKGNYIVGLIEVLPTYVEKSHRPNFIGCQSDYYWWQRIDEDEDGIMYELILPFVAESTLNNKKIEWYQAHIQKGNTPTALALSMVEERIVSGRFREWAIVHYLLDGHHKVMAASKMATPITILSFLRETSLTGYPMVDPTARERYLHRRSTSMNLQTITKQIHPEFDYTADQITYISSPYNQNESEANDLADAVDNLGASGDPRAIRALIGLLASKLRVVKYGSEYEGQLSSNVIRALRRIGEPAIDDLISVLLNSDKETHLNARTALEGNEAVRNNERMVDLLLPSMDSPDPMIRNSIVKILGEVGTPRAMKLIVERLINDSDTIVRNSAIISLRDHPTVEAKSLLLNIIRTDPDLKVRAYAIQGLVAIKDRTVIAKLVAMLPELHGNRFLQEKIMWAIEQLNT